MNGAGVIAAGPLGSTKPCSRGAGQSYVCPLQGIEARHKWVRAIAFGYICRRDDSAFPCADTSGLSCSHGLIIRFTVLCVGVDIAYVLDLMTPPTCPRCLKPVSLDDTLMFDGAQARHLDCRRPHALSPVELRLLFQHCFDHAVAECASCSQAFRQTELGSDLLSHRTNLCSALPCGPDRPTAPTRRDLHDASRSVTSDGARIARNYTKARHGKQSIA